MQQDKTTYTLSPEVLYHQMGDEIVLLHMGSGHYYGLDEVGARFWQLLTENGDPERAYPILLEEFDVDEATLRPDLQRLLLELTEATLILPAK